MAAEPYCLAMVLCDHVHRDVGTGKFTLLGTFSTFMAKEYPASVQFTVYFSVTDGIGDMDIWLKIVDARTGLDESEYHGFTLETPRMACHFPNPLAVVEGVIGIQAELEKPGLYHCELFANNALLMSRRLLAQQFGEQNDDS